MERRLIFNNEKKANELIAFVEKVLPDISEVYTMIRALDDSIDPAISEVKDVILDRLNFKDMACVLIDHVQDAILDKVGDVDFKGVKLDKEKLKGLLSFPSCTAILKFIDSEFSNDGIFKDQLAKAFGYFECSEGAVVPVDGYEDAIRERFKIFTKTEKGAIMVDKLTLMAQTMTDINAVFGGKNANRPYLISDNDSVKGIRFERGVFRVDHVFVMDYEQRYIN